MTTSVRFRSRIDSATDDSSSRYTLGSVQVSPNGDGVYATATDGRIAVVLHCEGQCESPVMVPGEALPKLKGELSGKFGHGKLTQNEDGTWTRQTSKGQVTVPEATPGKYPNCGDVLPVVRDCTQVSLKASLVKKLVDAMTSDPEAALTFFVKDDESAVGVLGPNGVGVIMPLAASDHRDAGKRAAELATKYELHVSDYKEGLK